VAALLPFSGAASAENATKSHKDMPAKINGYRISFSLLAPY